MMTNKKILIATGVMLAAAIAVAFLLVFDNKAATVNGEKISKSELDDALSSQYGSTVLDTLISDEIIRQEMKKENIKVSDKEIAEEMEAYMDTFGGEDTFNEVLKNSGVDVSIIEKNIMTYLASKKILEPKIEITDEEIQTYFDENKDSFDKEEEVEASHILVDDEKTAKEVVKKIEQDEDFAELAKEYSTDTATKDNGGELGFFAKGDMVKEFEEKAFGMENGDISEPVKTEYGYHIIKVTDKQEPKKAELEEVKDEIKDILLESKLESEYSVWLNEKFEEYEIKTFL
ncbi:peptidylprolyl isomerase [Cytobacillus horneckiae]|nr:peptidylprolyl isomerase [Cytobacillus horneckiae]MBN6888083.1 peptidylprolyl isomerase [Cytobacillus horneckiae]MCM3176938.1 peptidylprolyl isomerase [Cytobacillus horneckiae]MEC1154638.1 peptidylprolyl isomerase [Cytobacillus horneckiae]MED2938979.1 peptidylprolyl isomerase [Cytobacillus horneckiae]